MGLTEAQNLDPRTIHVRQGITWRGIFTWSQPVDPEADPIVYEPVPTAGYMGVFVWLAKRGGVVLLSVESPDSDDGGIEIDEVLSEWTPHLTATQTMLLVKDGFYELRAVSVDDPDDVILISAGFANLILTGEAYPYPAVD